MNPKYVRVLVLTSLFAVGIVLNQNCSSPNYSSALDGSSKVAADGSVDVGSTPAPSASPVPNASPVPGASPVASPIPGASPVAGASPAPGASQICNDQARDFELNVLQILAIGNQGESVTLSPVSSVLHLADFKMGVAVVFPKAMVVSEIRIILKDDGNKIIDAKGDAHPLKTPSAQESGLKIHLEGDVSVKAGQIYKLKEIDISSLIRLNGQNCMLHPVCEHARVE